MTTNTFFVGKLKGVGKVWQITACDVACSYGFAQLMLGEITASAVARFMTRWCARPTRGLGGRSSAS